MEIEQIDIKLLKPYDKNAKKHPRDQVNKIASSIKEFGFKQPVLIDKDNLLIAGHGRLLAAKKLKLETIPAIRVEDLSEKQIKAFRLADNRTAQSDWDVIYLKDEFVELQGLEYDLTLTGFDDKEINDLLGVVDTDVVEVKSYEREKVKTSIKRGDIYGLGAYIIKNGKRVEVEIL